MYIYNELKPEVFKEENQKSFLKIRDRVHEIIGHIGVITMEDAIHGVTASSWEAMAMVDRLVELGEIREEYQSGDVAGQHRKFRK